MTLYEEISELEIEVTQASREKISMMGLSLSSPTTALEGVATLLPWLRPHLTEQGSILYKEERDRRVFEGCPWPRLAGKMKPRTGGATTSLSVGSTVSALQVVERECGNIKESIWELRNP